MNKEYKVLEEIKNKKSFLTVKELSETKGISLRMAYQLIHIKDFPVIYSGRRAYIISSKVDSWFENNIGITI